jgi:hypothetical protein
VRVINSQVLLRKGTKVFEKKEECLRVHGKAHRALQHIGHFSDPGDDVTLAREQTTTFQRRLLPSVLDDLLQDGFPYFNDIHPMNGITPSGLQSSLPILHAGKRDRLQSRLLGEHKRTPLSEGQRSRVSLGRRDKIGTRHPSPPSPVAEDTGQSLGQHSRLGYPPIIQINHSTFYALS